jgi:hypothetical protein
MRVRGRRPMGSGTPYLRHLPFRETEGRMGGIPWQSGRAEVDESMNATDGRTPANSTKEST